MFKVGGIRLNWHSPIRDPFSSIRDVLITQMEVTGKPWKDPLKHRTKKVTWKNLVLANSLDSNSKPASIQLTPSRQNPR